MFASTIGLKNDHIMGKAVTKLLVILSNRETTGPLTLELNASSASDSKHWFKNFRFNDEHDAPYARSSVLPMEAMHSDWHDPKHDWENGARAKHPPFSANDRLFQRLMLARCLPTVAVNAVTCVMIRRQFRHSLYPPEIASLLSRFGRLTDFIYEPWPKEYSDSKWRTCM
jgi:hypothetical protein